MKPFIFLLFPALMLLGVDDTLQDRGVAVQVSSPLGEMETITVKREIADPCYDVTFGPETVWGGKYAAYSVPDACKGVFATHFGHISPMTIAPGVVTVGELELLAFLEAMPDHDDWLLVDSRTPAWYYQRTIPGAVNIPFLYLIQPEKYPDRFKEELKTIGVQETKNGYDFSNAKTLLMFCNGAWCGQSPMAVKALLKMGYPAKKIHWYRGGMQDWLMLGMKTYEPVAER